MTNIPPGDSFGQRPDELDHRYDIGDPPYSITLGDTQIIDPDADMLGRATIYVNGVEVGNIVLERAERQIGCYRIGLRVQARPVTAQGEFLGKLLDASIGGRGSMPVEETREP